MKSAYVVAGMAFGDEGKGTTTEYLCHSRSAGLVVRYNGGPQAAHHVVLKSGVYHAFSQFGSGTFQRIPTFLSKFMLINPVTLANEGAVLKEKGVRDPLSLVSIDPECIVITPYHRIANRIREERRREGRHGSVGVGVGEARSDALVGGVKITARHLSESVIDVAERMRQVQKRKINQLLVAGQELTDAESDLVSVDPAEVAIKYKESIGSARIERWSEVSKSAEMVVFEGAQGVLLDEAVGYEPPHVTWTNCTFGNADTLIVMSGGGVSVEKIGVFRTYFTRHGHGPFPTETGAGPEEIHNSEHPWMGKFRTGRFDTDLALYSMSVAPPDVLAFTHLDRAPLPQEFARLAKVKYLSHGPTLKDKESL